MLVRKCDKCGKVIEKNYWSVVFNQHPDEYGRYTTDGVLTNIKQNQTQKFYLNHSQKRNLKQQKKLVQKYYFHLMMNILFY